jgi:hypothetical protein
MVNRPRTTWPLEDRVQIGRTMPASVPQLAAGAPILRFTRSLTGAPMSGTDIHHILFGCRRAKEVWEELAMKEVIEHAMTVDRSGSVVLEYIL